MARGLQLQLQMGLKRWGEKMINWLRISHISRENLQLTAPINPILFEENNHRLLHYVGGQFYLEESM